MAMSSSKKSLVGKKLAIDLKNFKYWNIISLKKTTYLAGKFKERKIMNREKATYRSQGFEVVKNH